MKKFISENNVLLVFVSILVVISIIIALFWPFGKEITSEEIYSTGLGDEFLFKHTEFPNAKRRVSIYSSNDEFLGSFVVGGKSVPEMTVLIDTDELRCYELGGYLIFKVGDADFKSVCENFLVYDKNTCELTDGNDGKIDVYVDDPDYVFLANQLFLTKQWKWVKAFGWLLLSARDHDAKSALERYAEGRFTSEELSINSRSEIEIDEVEEYTKQILRLKT